MEIELNSHGVNKAIKPHILSDEEMKLIGFHFKPKTQIDNTEFPSRWTYMRFKDFGSLEVSFYVELPTDNSDIKIDILDEDYCQPYDYQYMIEKSGKNAPKYAFMVRDWVEEQIEYLQAEGVLSGHIEGEYI